MVDHGAGAPTGIFAWDQAFLKGGRAEILENDGTPAALEWLVGTMEQGLVVDGEELGLRDVKGEKLAPIKADQKNANGKSDGCIAEESKYNLSFASRFRSRSTLTAWHWSR